MRAASRLEADRRALVVALGLLVAFMAFEVAAAVAANSLVLLADAGHMLVDVGAIAGSLLAIQLAARPETGSHTYGMKRAEILAAAGNAIALIVVSAMVAFEAVSRLRAPHAGRRRRPRLGGRRRRGGQPRRHRDALEGEPAVAQRRGGVPARPDGSLRIRRHHGGRHPHRDHGLHSGRPAGLAGRRRP